LSPGTEGKAISVLPPPPGDVPASSHTKLFLVSSLARSQSCCRGGHASLSHLFRPGAPMYKPTPTHQKLGRSQLTQQSLRKELSSGTHGQVLHPSSLQPQQTHPRYVSSSLSAF
uniref:Uncharacterized protein n=1 Tax=Serinus canaria TaxID=9135 RepID=A0A8C9NXR7_SERCA